MSCTFEFSVESKDYRPPFHPYDETNGVVATAFKRQFPEISLQGAHGDYYLGIGKSLQNYHRYEFRIEDQPKIQKLFLLTPSSKPFESFTVRAERK